MTLFGGTPGVGVVGSTPSITGGGGGGLKRTLVYSNTNLTLTAGSGATMVAVIDDPTSENYSYEFGIKNLSTLSGFSFLPQEWNSFAPTFSLDWTSSGSGGGPRLRLWAQAHSSFTAVIALKIWRVEH
jgi:hypothetical protein